VHPSRLADGWHPDRKLGPRLDLGRLDDVGIYPDHVRV